MIEPASPTQPASLPPVRTMMLLEPARPLNEQFGGLALSTNVENETSPPTVWPPPIVSGKPRLRTRNVFDIVSDDDTSPASITIALFVFASRSSRSSTASHCDI